jgi:hypothetical protein
MIEKFKNTLKKEGVTVEQFCKKIGLLPDSFRRLTDGSTPKWIKSFNFGYWLGTKTKEK